MYSVWCQQRRFCIPCPGGGCKGRSWVNPQSFAISMWCKWKITFVKSCGVNGTTVLCAVETEKFG